MTGLVDQLQVDALDPNIPVSTLLRKVKVAAVKLGLDDAVKWVEPELNGYSDAPPDYRQASGEPHGWNPYHGWQAMQLGDEEMAEMLSTFPLVEPIANYERLIGAGDGVLHLNMGGGIVNQLRETFGWEITKAAVHIPRGVIVKVIEHVRNMVLDWALELERNGVRGEGLSFSAEERQKASGAHIHIGAFHGSFSTGDANGVNARINNGSLDNSTNLSGDGSVFGQIEAAVRAQVKTGPEQEAIIAANKALRDARPADRLSAYQKLVTAAADHMTVLSPFLPALTGMLGG